MKKFLVYVVFVLCIFSLVACLPKDNNRDQKSEMDIVIIQTSANWTYIQLGLRGTIEENSEVIGNAIFQWEEQNPDREIVSVVPVYRNSSYGAYYNEVDGLSIYSRLR